MSNTQDDSNTDNASFSNASHLLGIEAAAEMQRYFDQRSADIAAHFGIPAMLVSHLREINPLYWELLERRWMTETFGPLAPLYLLEQQARADRQALRDARRAARREAWAKAEKRPTFDTRELSDTQELSDTRKAEAMSGRSSCSPPACSPRLWQRATLALMDWLHRLTGPACLLALCYYVVVWLTHHDVLLHSFLLH